MWQCVRVCRGGMGERDHALWGKARLEGTRLQEPRVLQGLPNARKQDTRLRPFAILRKVVRVRLRTCALDEVAAICVFGIFLS